MTPEEQRKDLLIFVSRIKKYSRHVPDEFNNIGPDSSDIDIAKATIDYYHNKTDPSFYDYEDSIHFMFIIIGLIGFNVLDEEHYSDRLLNNLHVGLLFAGKPYHLGKSYKGIETIENYRENLSYEDTRRILSFTDSTDNLEFYNRLDSDVIQAIIDNNKITEDQRARLKYLFCDRYYLCDLSLKHIRTYIQKMYPRFQYANIDYSCNPKYNHKHIILYSLTYQEKLLYILLNIDNLNDRYSFSLSHDTNNEDTDINITFGINDNSIIDFTVNCRDPKDNPPLLIQFNFNYKKWQQPLYSDSEMEKLDKFFHDITDGAYREYFELVYFYTDHVHDKGITREIYFRHDFDIDIANKKISLSNNTYSMPANFFGKHVNNIYAVIGKNGSGKSSVFQMIADVPIFSGMDKELYVKKYGNYLVIYKLGNNYYYDDPHQAFTVDDNITNLMPSDQRIKVGLGFISNTYEPLKNDSYTDQLYGDNRLSNTRYLTTNYLLNRCICQFQKNVIASSHDDSHQNRDISITANDIFRNEEVDRINNLKYYIQNNPPKPDFKLKLDSDPDKLSSGEYSRLTFFARILSLFYKDEKCSFEDPIHYENWFLLFDEAELYMHPEWQRELINDCIDFLEYINENERFFSNITLLFSSNSPFLMSDLPSSHIQLFDGEMSEKTFGQNIYSILKDSFFMPDGSIGAFAYKKISIAFENAASNKTSDQDDTKYIINIMGDELIKTILERHLNV